MITPNQFKDGSDSDRIEQAIHHAAKDITGYCLPECIVRGPAVELMAVHPRISRKAVGRPAGGGQVPRMAPP